MSVVIFVNDGYSQTVVEFQQNAPNLRRKTPYLCRQALAFVIATSYRGKTN